MVKVRQTVKDNIQDGLRVMESEPRPLNRATTGKIITDKNQQLAFAAGFREMTWLLQERGRIRAFDYGLALKILDHIEVTQAGKLAVIFLTGTKVII